MNKNHNYKISKEGEEFILNLNMYLMSRGKSENEIKELIDEVEEHLILGEQEGKSVEDIFGNSPEEYAKSVAKELFFSKKELIEIALIFILGFVTWIFLGNIENGIVTMSIMESILSPLNYVVTVFLLIVLARKFAFKDKKFTIGVFLLMSINICVLVVIGILGRNMEQSIVINKSVVSIITIILFVLSLVVSKKIGVWYLMMAFIFNIHSIIENFTNISFENNILVDIIPLLLCISIFIFESIKIIKSKV